MRLVQVMIVLAVLVAVVGLFVQTTLGLGLVALGVLIAVVARMVQAAEHHDQVMEGFAELIKRMEE
jgi:hypothetical protein